MIPADDETPRARARRVGLEEEQALCVAALESGDYDGYSDAAWLQLCEEVARGTRAERRPEA